MLSFDSFKFKVRSSVISILDERLFHKTVSNGVVLYRRLDLRSTGYLQGIKSILIGPVWSTFEFSAKILGQDYPELLNIRNITHLQEVLNGIIEFHWNDLLNTARVLRVDVTADYFSTEPVDDLILALFCIKNSDFIGIPHLPNGIEFKKICQSSQSEERQIFYDKLTELESNKRENRAFLRNIPDPDELKERFLNVLRAEVNLATPARISRALGVSKDCFLVDVLNSRENPLLALFLKIRGDQTFSIIDAFPKEKSFLAEEKALGQDVIISQCGRNIHAVKRRIVRKICGNPTEVLRRYQHRIKTLELQDKLGLPYGNNLLNTIETFLRSQNHPIQNLDPTVIDLPDQSLG